MYDEDMVTVFHFYVCVLHIFLFFLHKRQRFMTIFDKKSYVDTTILYKGHQHKLEAFAEQYKTVKGEIVLSRSNDEAMTLRSTTTYKAACVRITNPFDDIIHLNTKAKTVRVGAMITMGKLMNYLYPLGYALPVVPEFKSLTVGGLIAGAGLESSSVHYGLFPLQCKEYTVVLGNGEIRKVTEETDPILFSALPLSYGTLGTIVDVVMTIIKVKPNVRLQCITIKDYAKVQQVLETILKDTSGYDFIEGIIYHKTKTVIIKGVFTDTLVYPVIHPVTWYDPYFYQSIEQNVDEGKDVCTMNLLDYYFRHDRGSFWLLKHIMGDNKLCRAVNPFVNHASDKNIVLQPIMNGILKCRQIEIQDSVVPLSKTQSILEFAEAEYAIYPIWLCVCRNVDATLRQKTIMYKLLKSLSLKEKEGLTMLITNKKHRKILEILLELSETMNCQEIIKYIKQYKEFFYTDQVDSLIEELSKEIAMSDKITKIISAVQLKTSFLGLLQSTSLEDFYVDIGIYGCSHKVRDKDKLLEQLEKMTYNKEGYMGQYAVTTLSREQFEDMVLKKEWYSYVRKKYHAEGRFPDIYDKLGGITKK